MKKIVMAVFTREGVELASRLAEGLGNPRVFAPPRMANAGINGAEPFAGTVFDWAAEWFSKAGALVFISAAGIAVRAVAPCLKDKTSDPAVVVLDDAGHNVISLLSGHIGGGNDLARRIAAMTGGNAVVTTATDTHGIEAVDEWAVKNNCAIENPEAIKIVSAAMLNDDPINGCRGASLTGRASCCVAITDELFEELSPPWPVTLRLRPRVLVLGIGCKRGVEKHALGAAVDDFLRGAGKSLLSLKAAASIDLKRDEPAIADFCRENGIPFLTYSADELSRAGGHFTPSQKVMEITGVDNVCERAAVLAAHNGALLRSKTLYPGIALALAREAVR